VCCTLIGSLEFLLKFFWGIMRSLAPETATGQSLLKTPKHMELLAQLIEEVKTVGFSRTLFPNFCNFAI